MTNLCRAGWQKIKRKVEHYDAATCEAIAKEHEWMLPGVHRQESAQAVQTKQADARAFLVEKYFGFEFVRKYEIMWEKQYPK